MYTLIVSITMFGWFSDDKSSLVIDGFKTQQVCEVAGEPIKADNTTRFVGKTTYTCVRKS
ncbi:hypothetical protein vBAbaMPhT2_115 [Acinetobacter phage vB_AbaM_PhT2]|uniref:Uncharacterized protein n=1 Tax=Acinetobacter phage vB_AbaM_PhT2 TaxID=2690230 RepID=A0A6B9SXT7_9CAUD|nr:hypothetical protein HYQ24_gp115 [Acinetobacter phage vB_AbaM_PhT2]QHJ75727.1 hypothetical protein vBAbaMPhT2_115 [Acinetobacter phage vB_AbaM_PhT2]